MYWPNKNFESKVKNSNNYQLLSTYDKSDTV